MSVAFFGAKAVLAMDLVGSVIAEDDEIVVRDRAGQVMCTYRPESSVKEELDNVYEQLFYPTR